MDSKLFDSERKVMEVLWRYGDMHAGELADILKSEIGWRPEHYLYRDQKMRGKRCDRAPGTQIFLSRPDYQNAGAGSSDRRSD